MEKIKNNKTKHIFLVSIFIVLMIVSIYSNKILGEPITITDGSTLIEQAKIYSGSEIIYLGEIVGDIMSRQNHYWINVSSNGTAIGIWITEEQRAKINLVGRYGIRGDEVKIIGLFNQACAEHGGDLDIHANSIEIINRGYNVPNKIDFTRLTFAICLFLIASCCLFLFIRSHFQHK